MRKNNIQALAESAILIALAVVLSMFAVYEMPMGGSVMIFAMTPLVIISLRRGLGWGLGASLTFGVIHMILGQKNFAALGMIGFSGAGYYLAVLGVALLDYLLAFGAYGLAALFAKPFKNKSFGYGAAALACGALQFLCSFISGIIIWKSFAEDMPVALYSLLYNGTYSLPNTTLTVIGTVAAMAVLDRVFPAGQGESNQAIGKRGF